MVEDGNTITTVPLPFSGLEDFADGPTFVRRLALGAIALFGLFHGLKHLTLAIGLYFTGSAVVTPEGTFGLLVASTLAATVIAGTVNRRAELTGTILGLTTAGISVAMEASANALPSDEWLVGMPILLAAVGIIGGLAGRLMVPPAPTLPLFGQVEVHVLAKAKRPSPKIVWWRIGGGVVLAVFASIYADNVRQLLSKVLVGHSGSYGSTPLLTWQISVLGTILGGVVAGANTHSGVRQGVIAGLIVACGSIVAEATRGDAGSHLLEFWEHQLDLRSVGPLAYAVLAVTAVIATSLGSWLGSHLFPPPRRR